MSRSLLFLLLVGWMIEVCVGTPFNCTPESQVPSNVTCEGYMLGGLNCSAPELANRFPGLYAYINGDLYPNRPSSLKIIPFDIPFKNGKVYPGANITIKPPQGTSSIRDVTGFELSALMMNSNEVRCVIFNLNGTKLSSANYESEFNVSLPYLHGQIYFNAYSLPKPPADEDKGKYLEAFFKARDPWGMDFTDVPSGNWVASISYRTLTSKREIQMWFVAPPTKYNFSRFQVELWQHDNVTGRDTTRVNMNVTGQLTYTFHNVADGIYRVKLLPDDPNYNNANCLCKKLFNNNIVCGSCTRTISQIFQFVGTDVGHGLSCSTTPSCRTSAGLLCIDGLCVCNSISHFWNETNCEQKQLFGEICGNADQCQNNVGLICSGGHCACYGSRKYWSRTMAECVQQHGYKENCTFANECRVRDGLLCVDGQCRCNISNYWSNSMSSCSTKHSYNKQCRELDSCMDEFACLNDKCQCDQKIWSEDKGRCVVDDTHAKIVAATVGTIIAILLLAVMGFFVFFRYRSTKVKTKQPVENIGIFDQVQEVGVLNCAMVPENDNPEHVPEIYKKTVLVVYTEDHHQHTEAIKSFANFLSAYCKCDVIFGPWCLQQIMEDKFRWLINSIEKSDFTILINSMESFHQYETWKRNGNPFKPLPESPIGDIFLPAIHMVASKLVKNFDHSRYIMAYFEYTEEHFVIDDICPGGKYMLPKHFDELLSHIHRLNTHNQRASLKAVGLPQRDNLGNTPEGRKLIEAVKSAGKFQKENPNWFVEKIENCDSGIDEEMPIAKIIYDQSNMLPGMGEITSEQMNVLSNPADVMSNDSNSMNYPFIHGTSGTPYNGVSYLPDVFQNRHDQHNGLNNLGAHPQDVISFYPPSSIGKEDMLSVELNEQIHQINDEYMIRIFNESMAQHNGDMDSDIQSLGGKSV